MTDSVGVIKMDDAHLRLVSQRRHCQSLSGEGHGRQTTKTENVGTTRRDSVSYRLFLPNPKSGIPNRAWRERTFGGYPNVVRYRSRKITKSIIGEN